MLKQNNDVYPQIKYTLLYQGHQHLRDFKYKGGTASYSYSLIWSPLADKLTELFPKWLAPNIITLIALILLVVVHGLFYFVGGENDGWKLYLMGLSILIYQTLDNIDGKQARRTKSSSVLGMLLDHGSDSISGFFITIQMTDVLFIQDVDLFYSIIFLFLMISFFIAILTQYATGQFKLGKINAIDQGLPSYAIVCLIGAHVDFRVLKQFHIFGTYIQELLVFLTCLNIFMQYNMIKNILANPQKSIQQIVKIWVLPISIAISLLALRFIGPHHILSSVKYTLIYIVMFMWSRNMILIQLCCVSKQQYQVFNRGTLIFITGIFVFLLNYHLDIFEINTLTYFRVFLGIQALVFMQFVCTAFQQIAEVLGINIFTIPSVD